jgi:ankyrin repeat protein
LFNGTLRPKALAVLALLSLGAATVSGADTGPQTLVDLIRSGQREAVLAAITSPYVDVNTVAPDGSTPLMWAVYNVDHEMARALLKRGAKANVINRLGDSAIAEAVKVGDVELVRMLLDAGANPDSANQDGETALMLAANVGSLPIAQLLIQRGAKVNAVETFRGQTALMWAAAENHPDVAGLLIKHHADVNVHARYDDWPRQMTSEPRAQFRQTGGLTALLYATRSGCYRCAVALIKAHADVNQPNPDGVTPLINAIDNRNYDLAMFLLDKGANPGVWDMSGRTALYVAVDMHSFNPRSLAFGGLAFGAKDAPVQRAPAKATAMDVVNRLLAMGVDPNHQLTRMRPNGAGRGRFEEYMLRGGTGPLMVAAMRHDNVALKALLGHGAEADLPNVFRITPLMAACGMSGSGRGNDPEPGNVDVQAGATETVELLLKAGANINARVTNSHTHTAELVAYVRGRDHEGQTALFAAAESGWNRVVADLLGRGADAAVRDNDRKTALDYAEHPPAAFAGRGAQQGPRTRSEDAGRAATVALLQAALTKPGAGVDTVALVR